MWIFSLSQEDTWLRVQVSVSAPAGDNNVPLLSLREELYGEVRMDFPHWDTLQKRQVQVRVHLVAQKCDKMNPLAETASAAKSVFVGQEAAGEESGECSQGAEGGAGCL